MKEIVKWVIISDYEGTIAIFDTEQEALTSASFVGKTKIVKMVGQIPEQKKPFEVEICDTEKFGANGCQVDTLVETTKIMLEEALMWLDQRKKQREKRGVEGRNHDI